MNNDIIKGKWHQIKGRVKQQWSKLTDNDVTRIEGNLEHASGVIQERYGHSKEQAQREWNEFCGRCAADSKSEEV